MPDLDQQQLVAELARQVVADVAPKELPLFRPLSLAYFKDPEKTVKGTGGADKMLGFGGMATVGNLMTPAILQSTQVGLESVMSGFKRHVNREIEQLHSWLTDATARPSTMTSVPSPEAAAASSTHGQLSGELLDEVQRVILAQLHSLQVPDEQCPVLAGKICTMLSQGKIVEETLARERKLEQQVQELKIEVDQIKQSRDVEQIVQSDYFASLCQRASVLRQQAART